MPSLLALGCVHNHLIRCGLRTRADLVVETGDAHQRARLRVPRVLLGLRDLPSMAHDCIRDLCARGELALPVEEALANYDRAVTAGIVSIMSKMGISTMQGYHSAQIFEILGLSDELVESASRTRPRAWAASRSPTSSASSTRATTPRRRSPPAPRPTSSPRSASPSGAPGTARSTSSTPGHLPAAARLPRGLRPLQGVLRLAHRPGAPSPCATSWTSRPPGRPCRWRRWSPRADRAPLQHRRDELRLDQPRAARVPGHSDEPPARSLQHRRGRRGPGARGGARKRRLRALRDQAGGLRPLWRHEPLPGVGRRDPDQDGPGRQAGRGRAPARAQGLPWIAEVRQSTPGVGPDLPAAAPRHLLDRGPGGAHL